MKTFYVDGGGGGEFISVKLKNICNKKSITIKYTVPYIFKENGFVERGQRIIMIMKNLLLIDSNLLLEFWAETIDKTNYL